MLIEYKKTCYHNNSNLKLSYAHAKIQILKVSFIYIHSVRETECVSYTTHQINTMLLPDCCWI